MQIKHREVRREDPLYKHPAGIFRVISKGGSPCTIMLSAVQLPHIRNDFNNAWENADEEVRQVYGKDYMDNQYKAVAEHSKTGATSLAPVIDTMEIAVSQSRIRARYLVDGSNQLGDFTNVSLVLSFSLSPK